MNDLVTDIDTVVAIHLPYLAESHYIGTVNAHELLGRQHLLNGLHRQMGNQRLALIAEVEHHIVLQATDVEDVADGYLAELAIDLNVKGRVKSEE